MAVGELCITYQNFFGISDLPRLVQEFQVPLGQPYYSEGLIFSSRNTSYKVGIDKNTFKWTPLEGVVMDFRLVESEDGGFRLAALKAAEKREIIFDSIDPTDQYEPFYLLRSFVGRVVECIPLAPALPLRRWHITNVKMSDKALPMSEEVIRANLLTRIEPDKLVELYHFFSHTKPETSQAPPMPHGSPLSSPTASEADPSSPPNKEKDQKQEQNQNPTAKQLLQHQQLLNYGFAHSPLLMQQACGRQPAYLGYDPLQMLGVSPFPFMLSPTPIPSGQLEEQKRPPTNKSDTPTTTTSTDTPTTSSATPATDQASTVSKKNRKKKKERQREKENEKQKEKENEKSKAKSKPKEKEREKENSKKNGGKKTRPTQEERTWVMEHLASAKATPQRTSQKGNKQLAMLNENTVITAAVMVSDENKENQLKSNTVNTPKGSKKSKKPLGASPKTPLQVSSRKKSKSPPQQSSGSIVPQPHNTTTPQRKEGKKAKWSPDSVPTTPSGSVNFKLTPPQDFPATPKSSLRTADSPTCTVDDNMIVESFMYSVREWLARKFTPRPSMAKPRPYDVLDLSLLSTPQTTGSSKDSSSLSEHEGIHRWDKHKAKYALCLTNDNLVLKHANNYIANTETELLADVVLADPFVPEFSLPKEAKKDSFDVISMFDESGAFFSTEETCRRFLQFVSEHLKDDGHLLLVTLDYEAFLQQLVSTGLTSGTFGNSEFQVSLLCKPGEIRAEKPFGKKLQLMSHATHTSVTDYLVREETLSEDAKYFGLSLVEGGSLNFHDVAPCLKRHHAAIWQRLKEQPEKMELTRLFRTLVYRKQGPVAN
eukprot:TRINITY_DN68147_c2_g1_i1.p1 TRINITY_DN68147_c2_g1~~TRINITY_DN68147_c2_g1_i1.p1  ORF type:complete len:928 (+),score=96.72 TRINITY_DN68147_c2_g1_i1:316-2784(+)